MGNRDPSELKPIMHQTKQNISKMPPKSGKRKSDRTKTTTIAKWYPAEDEKNPRSGVKRPYKAPALRKNIEAGQVLILLVGRYKGRRVVFLKQLQSGLLLVTGPHKINGVPPRRVNQSTVIPTSYKVSLAGVDASKINDDYFARTAVKAAKKSEEAFFAQEGQQLSEAEKKKTQATLDAGLLANIKKVELLRQYMRSRFT